MKTTHSKNSIGRALIVIMFTTLFNSCSSDTSSWNFDPFPSNVGGGMSYYYDVHLQRVTPYVVNSSIQLDTYNSADSISFRKLTSKTFKIPMSDTTIYFFDALPGTFHYLTWKVLSSNNDSISGGKTSIIKLHYNTSINIKY